ncbi:MAG: hypothetical protein ACP5HS_14585 [Anaerolineae bacterium]
MPDEHKKDRSDYFSWGPGDLVPANTPAPTQEERQQALLEKMPPELRKKVEARFDREEGKEKEGEGS